MGSVQRESNISTDLNMLLGTADTILQYDLTIESDHDWVHSISGPAHPVYNKPPTITLELTYYLNHNALVKQTNIMEDIEERLKDFIKRTDGNFMQRTVEPILSQGTIKLFYRIVLPTVEIFYAELERGAQIRLDAEFTKALEAKLSED